MIHRLSHSWELHSNGSVSFFPGFAQFLEYISIFLFSFLFCVMREYEFLVFVVSRYRDMCYMTQKKRRVLCFKTIYFFKDIILRDIFLYSIHSVLHSEQALLPDILYIHLYSFLKHLFFLSSVFISCFRQVRTLRTFLQYVSIFWDRWEELLMLQYTLKIHTSQIFLCERLIEYPALYTGV